ncbi:MAG: PrsW family intramembrane metalloprotease [Lachnospiraceae bacterium]|nr:PrsW family intramembrane metalloprotease [Lachnospiraceae bacterium]
MLHILALLPAVYLIIFVYQHDKVEKEPISLLLKLLFFGALSIVPTVIVGTILELLLGILLPIDSAVYNFFYMFIVVALVEEYWKRWAAERAWNHPAFNYRFDAIVYCVSAALGFAALENLLYVSEGGLSTAILRAVTAVPSHAIDGVIMGIFFGEAKICEMRGNLAGKKYYRRLSLLMPMLAHGYYDFCLTSGSLLMLLFFIIFVIVLDVWAVKYIKRASAEDEMI